MQNGQGLGNLCTGAAHKVKSLKVIEQDKATWILAFELFTYKAVMHKGTMMIGKAG